MRRALRWFARLTRADVEWYVVAPGWSQPCVTLAEAEAALVRCPKPDAAIYHEATWRTWTVVRRKGSSLDGQP